MQFSVSSAVLLFLPLTVLASPKPGGPAPQAANAGTAVAEARDLFTRSTQYCKIIGVTDYANCRTGPGTSYPANYEALEGVTYEFSCYEDGTCVDGNW
jgi:uncharacterized protein YraI